MRLNDVRQSSIISIGEQTDSSNNGTTKSSPSHRERRSLAHLYAFVCDAIKTPLLYPLHKASSGTSHHLSHFIDYERFSSSHPTFLAAIASHYEPKSFNQAVQKLCWRDTMAKEISASENNHTWVFLAFLPGKRTLGVQSEV